MTLFEPELWVTRHLLRRASMMKKLATTVGVPLAELVFLLMPLGALYWLWIAIQLGSFMMFVFGILGPAVAVTAPFGLYMLFFGVPHWVVNLFC
ncbi:MAG: hypothetical protein AB7O44_23600 [Hyphomicrobiaceae bacterium]